MRLDIPVAPYKLRLSAVYKVLQDSAKFMNMKSLKQAFSTIHKGPAPDLSSKKKEIARSLVPAHACGNVNLQLGRYSTDSDIEKRRQEVCAFDFTK